MNAIEMAKNRLRSRLLSYFSSIVLIPKKEEVEKGPINNAARGSKTKRSRENKYGKTYHTKSGLDAARNNKANSPI